MNMVFAIVVVMVTNIAIHDFGKRNHSLLKYLQLKEC